MIDTPCDTSKGGAPWLSDGDRVRACLKERLTGKAAWLSGKPRGIAKRVVLPRARAVATAAAPAP